MKKIFRFIAVPSAILAIVASTKAASTYTVTSLADSTNSGTLRWAIKSANDAPSSKGISSIGFATNGTINLTSPLPVLYKPSTINGTTAPGYTTSPVVSVNFQGKPGLIVAATAKGSSIYGLSLVRASAAALTLQGSGIKVSGNFIGLNTDGSRAGNNGDGISALPRSTGNLIGGNTVTTGNQVWYATNFPVTVSGWQGLRNFATNSTQTNADWYMITGTSGNYGLLFTGPINGSGGNSYLVSYPTNNINTTSIYSAGNVTKGSNTIILAGSYANTTNQIFSPGFTNYGWVWTGTTNDLQKANGSGPISTNGTFRTINYSTVKQGHPQYNFCHSVMGDLAVGNVCYPVKIGTKTRTLGPGVAYICDLTKQDLTVPSSFVTIPTKPLGAKSITAYGIWDNGNGTYTICGGYSTAPANNITNQQIPLTLGLGYLVDYIPRNGTFTNWKSFSYPSGVNVDVHFEGISSTEAGVYTLVSDLINGTNIFGATLSVNRNKDGTFSSGYWTPLTFPGVTNTGFVGADSVYGNQVVGIIAGTNNTSSFGCYQMTINTGFQRANVISGNGGNGINLNGSSSNTISQNYIGTDANGSTNAAYGNGRNGIQLSGGASGNMIGGQFIGSNNPTGSAGSTTPVFQRPPLGNLISANHLNGILIENGSQSNTISGNYIGTDGSGTNGLGNWFDGVDIENSIGNGLLGCAFYQNPFVYYNVISGNYGHGVHVNNANNTTFQGNYAGIDALDTTNVPNGGDGLLVSGSSKRVQIGGVIPLGSVISGNRGNGTEITGTVSYATNFNTFGGVPSFKTYAVPNYGDGILITSTGGHNTVRTCVMSGNLGNGVEIGGNATGVLIEDTTAGTTTDIDAPLPNQCNGIVISGSAHGNTIGGYNPSIETSVHASGNIGYGIAVLDTAYNNTIVNTRVGVGLAVTEQQGVLPPLPNQQGGVFVDQGTYATTIGGIKAIQANYINNNGGDGITINASRKNSIIGNYIMANDIGVYAWGNCLGTVLSNNFVYNNTNAPQVNISGATGIIIK